MYLTPFLLLATLFTIVQCFHTRNTYEQSQPEGMDEAIMRGNAKKRLHDTDISVPEINNIINDQTLEPFLSYSLQEKLLRSPFTIDRQKRQAKLDSERLKRILSTKKGRKMAEKLSRRKALLRMIQRRRKLRKQRKLRKGKTKGENEPPKPTVSTEESAGQQNNPTSTNEINLTVQVDMNNPPKAIDTNKSRSSLPQGNSNLSSSPSLEGLHQDYPITSQQVQAPQSPDTNIFGVMPNMNSPFRTRTVPDIYRKSSRMYPSLPGLISGQSVMKNKAFVNPAFHKPLLDAGHYGNFPNRILPLFDKQQARLLQEGTKHGMSAGEQNFEDGDDKKDKRVYDQTNPDNQREANLDFDHTQTERNHDKSNAPPENVQMNGEIKNLLQDIKDILNTRQPDGIKNDDDIVRQEDEQKQDIYSDMNNSVEIQSGSPLLSPVLQKEDANILDTAEETENKQPAVPSMQQYDQIGTDVIASFTENSDDELNKEEVILNTPDLVLNPNISTVILKDPNAKYEEKLLGMSTEDIIKTLQNLNLITKREKKIIQRMSKKWNSDDNFQNMLDQLMRRRYFRKSLRKVLERAGVSTVDKLSGHDLIIQLLRAEDILIPVKQHLMGTFQNIRIQDENINRFKDNKAFPGDNEHIFDNHPGINFPYNKQESTNFDIDQQVESSFDEINQPDFTKIQGGISRIDNLNTFLPFDKIDGKDLSQNEHVNSFSSHGIDNNSSDHDHDEDHGRYSNSSDHEIGKNHFHQENEIGNKKPRHGHEFHKNFSSHDHEIDKNYSNDDEINDFPSRDHEFDVSNNFLTTEDKYQNNLSSHEHSFENTFRSQDHQSK